MAELRIKLKYCRDERDAVAVERTQAARFLAQNHPGIPGGGKPPLVGDILGLGESQIRAARGGRDAGRAF
jgi:hypothetical protein